MRTDIDYYAVLSVSPTVSPNDLKRQYRRLAKIYHPDRNPGEEEWCSEQLRRVNEAFDLLSNPVKRREYDDARSAGKASTSAKPEAPRPSAADAQAGYTTWSTGTSRPTAHSPQTPRTSPAPPPRPRRRRRMLEPILGGLAAAAICSGAVYFGMKLTTPAERVEPMAPLTSTTTIEHPTKRTTVHVAHVHRSVRHVRVEHATMSHAHIASTGGHRHAARHLTAAQKDAIAGALAEKIEMAKRAASKDNGL